MQQQTEQCATESLESSWDTPASRACHDDPLLGCLTIIAKMLDRPCTSAAVTAGLPLEDNKLTPALFLRAAERAGLSARMIKRSLDNISPLVLPAVLLLENRQACILESVEEGGKLRIVQPESGGGVTEVAQEAIEKRYSGYVIFVRPSYKYDSRTKNIQQVRPNRWFWDTLKNSWSIYSEVVVASILINIFALVTPLFTMNVYDRVVPNKALETLWVLAIGVMIVFVFDLVIRALRGYFLDVASKRADIMLSATLFERMLGIKMSSRPASVGAFANNLQEFETVRDFLTSTTLTALIDLPFALLFIFIIWMIGGNLAWVALLLLPLAVVVSLMIQVPLGRTIHDMFKHSAQKHGALIETLTGLETIKSMGAEGPRQYHWEQAVGSIAKLSLKVRFLSAAATNFTAFVQQSSTVAVVLLGVYYIAAGELTVGALVACTLLTNRALAPLSQVVATLTKYHHAKSSLSTLSKLMEMPLERDLDKTFLQRETFAGEIEFRNVSFGYPGQEVEVLRDVSFKISPGEHVAIIGRVGSGKSTLEKLILGLYEPTSGAILIDGTDMRQLDPIDIRRNIGYIPQDVTLFYGNVKDNICLGMPYADDAAILRAAEIGGVTDFVNRHPLGFDLQIGERGEGLSGGQRQGMAIARALLHNPPILIMDEPSNSMDNTTEEQLKGRLADYVMGKTLMLVTHRASLLKLVSRIIVVDNGAIVADGPKERVLEALNQGKVRVSQS